jgi:hypothetical protein
MNFDKVMDFAIVKHPGLTVLGLVGMFFLVAVLEDSSRKKNMRENISVVQMTDDTTCYVYKDSVSCIRK